jgi:hypothetical protein
MDTMIEYWKERASGKANQIIRSARWKPARQMAIGDAEEVHRRKEVREWYLPSDEGIDNEDWMSSEGPKYLSDHLYE